MIFTAIHINETYSRTNQALAGGAKLAAKLMEFAKSFYSNTPPSLGCPQPTSTHRIILVCRIGVLTSVKMEAARTSEPLVSPTRLHGVINNIELKLSLYIQVTEEVKV
jgi:hypothetical protein